MGNRAFVMDCALFFPLNLADKIIGNFAPGELERVCEQIKKDVCFYDRSWLDDRGRHCLAVVTLGQVSMLELAFPWCTLSPYRSVAKFTTTRPIAQGITWADPLLLFRPVEGPP